jgi:hydrogenase nickel incorporation protein HypB
MKIEVKKNLLAKNDVVAAENRDTLNKNNVSLLNLMAAPGAGKTSLISRTIEALRDHIAIAVIEGDIASEVDSLAIEAMGIPAIQINTDGGCHLNASMIATALQHLDLETLDLIIIENVGNLVCPAEFDLGEGARSLIASVAEGHDKPYKYPMIFKETDTVIINKVDLLPYCEFDMPQFQQLVEELNPDVKIFEVSCTDGNGIEEWSEWLNGAIDRVR